MRKFIILLAVIFLLVARIEAAGLTDDLNRIGADKLQGQLPASAEEYIDEISFAPDYFTKTISEILSGTVSQGRGVVLASAALFLRLLLILILCRVVKSRSDRLSEQAVSLAGVFALTVCCAVDLRTMIGLGRSTMDEMMDFSTLLLPVMASAAAASGAATGAGIAYGVAVTFSRILIGICVNAIIPMIYVYLALGVTDSALNESRLSKLRELMAWSIKWGLKIVMYAYTGFITISGVLSGSVDSAALKAAKVTISGAVPVVGGIISDAADTVLYSAGILKSAVGTFGMLTFFAVCAAPFLRVSLHYLVFKLASVFGGVLGSSLCGFMECITTAAGFILAMLGSCIFMCLISCFCFMQVIGV